jgi:hypothetical protein
VARARSRSSIDFELRNRGAKAGEPSFHFSWCREVSAHLPPNPSQAAGQNQALSQLGDYIHFVIRVKEAECERQPLAGRNQSHHIEQKNQEIIGVTRPGWQRLVVLDLEIDQAHAPGFLIVNGIRGGRVRVRPGPMKMIAPKLMRAVNLPGRSLKHSLSKRSAFHVVPKTFARQFVLNHGTRTRSTSAETIAIQHIERGDFPALPLLRVTQKVYWYSRFAKISVGQIGQRLAGNIAPFDYNRSTAAPRFRDRIQIHRFDQRGRSVRQTLRHKPLRQFSSVAQKHFPSSLRRLWFQ